MTPPSDFSVLKNVQAIAQQNYVVQATAVTQHNFAVILKASILGCAITQAFSRFDLQFENSYTFVYRTPSLLQINLI